MPPKTIAGLKTYLFSKTSRRKCTKAPRPPKGQPHRSLQAISLQDQFCIGSLQRGTATKSVANSKSTSPNNAFIECKLKRIGDQCTWFLASVTEICAKVSTRLTDRKELSFAPSI